ncbi:biosynthetic-type acetolactate synthase large subunit [Anoxynatronum buryatiense]|uniref:Acetolactate synthase n=1 Tax=Anoxynatronum buryatiense TaxID=489973 RepID=A0AA45WT83_9CLOT|nr:biosynthetic-type acetolactate synthase large subunit [Anoxynatronum buryatiense]SMP41116.1 acetolactate synthase, large subunit [Anoxynatronum buryatiense]
MQLNGSQILMECLLEQGVNTVFGYPGGTVIHIFDALYEYQDRITHILTSHEQGATHAADGYARATGKTGVVIATSGPGATNTVTGIATAHMDSIPMVVVTGNVSLPLLGKDSFQEVDIMGVTMPITKHSFIVKDVNQLADTLRRAFHIANEGRPGPVLVDIPKDISVAMATYTPRELQVVEKQDTITMESLQNALAILKESKKPFILTGGGVIRADAGEEVLAFIEKMNAPFSSTLMGLGGVHTGHPLFTGMIGMHGSKTSNLAATQCDLLIAVGSRFSDRVISNVKGFAPDAFILHIDIDPAEVNKNVRAVHHLSGDVKLALQKLNVALEDTHVEARQSWVKQIQDWKTAYPLATNQNGTIKPHTVIRTLSDLTSGQAIVTTEVGQSQMWAAQYYTHSEPRTFLTSGGLGTMGFGLGACMGAAIGRKDKKVINIAGDGSFLMNCNELATAAHYRLPILIIILDNGVLGMVRQWQDLFFDKRYAGTTIERHTDFVKLAEAFGAKGYRLNKVEDVEAVLKEALAQEGPVVVHVPIDKDDKVFPMVPPGAFIQDLITEETL